MDADALDVLIVGAGPTGLMLANQLARRGVNTLIIDRHSGPAMQTRAIGVQARTLEIYAKLGVVDRALELGKRGEAASLWAQGRLTARVPVGDIGRGLSRFPYIFMLGQDDNERILGERLHDFDVDVQWNTELVALEQRPGDVSVALKQPDRTERKLTCAWVAGCDGARSSVRELNNIVFAGAPYEHVFFVADTVATGDMVEDEVNVYLWKKGFHLFFPMRGKDHWRVIGMLPPPMLGKPDLTFDEVVPSIRGEAGSRLEFHQCTWFSTYRIHHRCAEQFRKGRCFLLGDAAHIHSPVGAQGMNTGLQDAYNLAWKLALVVKGEANRELLDSYETERLPVAQRLLRTTDRAFMLVVKDTWLAALFRTQIMARLAAAAMRVERVRRLAFRTISQIGIRYSKSALSRTLPGLTDSGPCAGDRFPWLKLQLREDGGVEDLFEQLDDTRFNLLVFGQPPPIDVSRLSGAFRTHVVPSSPVNDPPLASVQIPRPSFYLLRPDGHVGLAGARFDVAAVRAYLSSCGLYIDGKMSAGLAAQASAMPSGT